LPSLHSMTRFAWILLVIALFGLAGNYILFLLALALTSPTVAQTLTQLSSIFLLLGGVVIFRERLSFLQRIGLVVLLIGLGLLFNKRFLEFNSMSGPLGWGIALAVLSAFVWSAYGLAQKRLLEELGSQQILLLIFFGSSILLLPFASPRVIPNMNSLQFGMLLFCCANSLIAYGSFAEALKHWKVSRVGAVITTAPLFTMASMFVAKRFMPGLAPSEELNAASIVGILFVVAGSALCALEGRRTQQS
jgi:drug/metabolite transporter (DMT)-like permease